MSDEEYFTNYDSDKNSDAENESQDNQNSIQQSSRKKIKHKSHGILYFCKHSIGLVVVIKYSCSIFIGYSQNG